MVKPEYTKSTVYIKALDRNIEVIEENYQLLKNLAPHIFEEKANDNNKSRANKRSSSDSNGESDTIES